MDFPTDRSTQGRAEVGRVKDAIVEGDRVFCSPQPHRPFQNSYDITRPERVLGFGIGFNTVCADDGDWELDVGLVARRGKGRNGIVTFREEKVRSCGG